MRPPRFEALLAGVAAAALAAPAGAAAEGQAFRLRVEHVLGTSLDLVAVAPDRETALLAAEAARAEIARLDGVLSGWRDDSELAQANRSRSHRASPDLYAVVDATERWRVASGGAFDGRLGAVERLWRSGAAPDPALLQRTLTGARDAVGLHPTTRTIHRPAGVTLALDGAAKGYVIDQALAAARAAAPALTGLMVDIGGDLRCWGDGPGGRWTVAIADPVDLSENATPAAVLHLTQGAVAVSGRGARDLIVEGAARSHLISPRTGEPAAGVALAAAHAPTAVDADALASALAVMPPAEGLALVGRTPLAEALVIDDMGRRHASSGWPRLAEARARLIRAAAPAARPAAISPAWPAGYGLTVNFELPRPTGSKIYSPYVAIWVTDESNRLVKTLLLQGNDLEWIDQNYIWWRRFGRSNPQVIAGNARPTRPAGRYTAVWDGRDDRGGRVGQGRYVVHLEAIRENGGHSYQSVNMTLGPQPATGAAAADEELGASRIAYGRRR